MKITLIDGIKDLISDQQFSISRETDMNEKYSLDKVRFKVKEGITRLNIGAFLGNTAFPVFVDWGLNKPIDRNPSQIDDCGEEVTLFFFSPSRIAVDGIDLGFESAYTEDQEHLNDPAYIFYKQIETQYDPLPESIVLGTIIIDSPDFTAPNGFTKNKSATPLFGYSYYTWEVVGEDIWGWPIEEQVFHEFGSNFKVAPRIWDDLSEVISFGGWSFYINPEVLPDAYTPFIFCNDLERIEFQGEFGERLEVLSACDFTFYDENGIGDPSAYPTGGSPRVVNNYVNMRTYALDGGKPLPSFDTSRLEVCKNPYNIQEVYIGHPGGSNRVVLPFGVDYSQTTVLKELELKLPKLNIMSGNFTGCIYYGWKSLGVTSPGNAKYVKGLYDINILKLEEGNEVDQTDAFVTGGAAAFPVTGEFIKTKVSFAWGQALEEVFDPQEEAIIPDEPTEAIYIDHYLRNISEGLNGTLVSKQNNQWTYFNPPRLTSTTLETVGSYCKNLYTNQYIGNNNTLENIDPDLTITLNGDITIPALPPIKDILKSFLEGTFSGVKGRAVREYEFPYVKPTAYLFYGERAVQQWTEEDWYWDEPYPAMNLKAFYNPQANGMIEEEYGVLNGQGPALGHSLLIHKIASLGTDGPTIQTNDTMLEGGVILEDNPQPLLKYNLNWMKDTWKGSHVIPSFMPKMLLPVPQQAKSEYAYAGALAVTQPVPGSKTYIEPFTTYGRDYNGVLQTTNPDANGRTWIRPCVLVVYWNPLHPSKAHDMMWPLEDFNLNGISLLNTSGSVYQAFDNAFRSNITGAKGSADDFFTAHGVDSTLLTTSERAQYIQLFNWDIQTPQWQTGNVSAVFTNPYINEDHPTLQEAQLSIPWVEENLDQLPTEARDDNYWYDEKLLVMSNTLTNNEREYIITEDDEVDEAMWMEDGRRRDYP